MEPAPIAELNLASLLRNAPGSEADAEAEGLFAPEPATLAKAGVRLEGPLAWHVTVRNAGGDDDFVVMGEVEGTALLDCRRCLKEVATPVTSSFAYPMIYRPGGEELHLIEDDDADDDLLAFGKPSVDFGPLLLEVFTIDQPITVLCKDDCKGLSVDGVDLNEHPDHVPEEKPVEEPSPFAVLKDLDLPS